MSFSLAILLSQEHFPLREMFVTTTIVIVLFTVFFQVGGDSPGPNISVREGWRNGEGPRLPSIAGGAGGAPPPPNQNLGGPSPSTFRCQKYSYAIHKTGLAE